MIRSLVVIAGLVALLAAGPAAAQDVPVYADGLLGGFQNFSYGGGSSFATVTPTHSGATSIALTGNATFNAVSFAHPSGPFTTAAYPRLRFFVHGGATGGQKLTVILQTGDPSVEVASGPLDAYITGGSIQANAWTQVEVRFGDPPLSFAGSFDRIDLQTAAPGGTQPVLYIDDVTLLAAAAAGITSPLLVEHDVTAGGMVSDRFTWRDASNQPRVAALAHNDGAAGPGGTRGGELRELRYETPAGTRIVRASGSAASGFGYVVAHRSEGTDGLGGADDSPLGHFFPGTFQRVFEGRHHAIFRFTQLYPRHSRQGAVPPNTQYNVPVTTDWIFSTGRDHPLWAVTWDLSAVPVDAVESDSRAPYGELLFDGAATEGAHSVVAGVGWGDRFKFASTTSPVTYNSAWTWDTPNTVPYVKLWTTGVDATMGTVQTQTIVQQDAGGYFGTNRWGTTSAAGNACTVAIGGVDHRMPCDFNWPYQSINFSLNPGTPAVPTNNTRLAWGANFGFLGQAQYLIHGSAFYGGPLPDTFAPGWPRKSYSTFVVLGLHSADPVGAQVAQIEAVQSTTLTASVGSVVTSGPAGVNRTDTVGYAPAGWNHVFAAWALRAAANQVDANFNVGGGAVAKPLVIISGWTAGALPATVRLNGVTLVQDADYFPSLRADSQELWITFNRTLAGATNRLEVVAGAAPVAGVSVTVNGAAFAPGSTLVASVTANTAGLPAVDVYLGVLFPDGNTVAFFTGAGTGFGRMADLRTLQPLAAGVSPAAPFTIAAPAYFSYGWTGSEPRGAYVFFLAAVRAGALADGIAAPDEILAISTARFTFGP
jgi:hypothetical protein